MTIKQPPIPDAVAALRTAIEPLRVFFADKYLELAFKEALKQDIPDTKASKKKTPRTSDKVFIEKLREKFGNVTFKAEAAAKVFGMYPGAANKRLNKLANKNLVTRAANNARDVDYQLPLLGM